MSISNTLTKRTLKEQNIVDAAERTFSKLGFANSKMENIAVEAGVSKGTVYFYFDTKENLYMAVIHRALQLLNDTLYRALADQKNSDGLTSTLAILETYFNFSEKHFFYSELMLDYMRLNRSASQQDKSKLTAAMVDSLYYRKTKDIQNIPFKITISEIEKGKEDGSIKSPENAEMLYLTAWASITGYLKLQVAAGQQSKSIHHVSLPQWKTYLMKIFKAILQDHL